MTFTFNYFDTEAAKDVLEIFIGPRTGGVASFREIDGNRTVNNTIDPLTLDTDQVVFVFRTDRNRERTGFSISWQSGMLTNICA